MHFLLLSYASGGQNANATSADTASHTLQQTLTHPATLAIVGLALLMLSALAIMAWVWLRNAKYEEVHMRIDL